MATVEIERTEVLTPFPPKPTEPDPALDDAGRTLMRAAEIVHERGWIQRAYENDEGVCVAHALGRALHEGGFTHATWYKAYKRFCHSVGLPGMSSWNDSVCQSGEQAAEALERAAYGL
jgi:hypothetical protein